MSEDKLIFNITFHWQLPQLKWHLENLLSWECSPNCEYVLVSAHRDNLTGIKDWITEHHPDTVADYLFIEEDHGNHLGCTMNVIEGIKYIRDNKQFDYLINIEADNMFRSETKLFKLIDKMKESDKHMLLVDHNAIFGPGLFTHYPHAGRYLHTTTLNVYSKYFVNEHLPLEYNKEFMGFGWYEAPGTPFEDYLALSFNKKHNLKTDDEILSYFNKWAYEMSYDQKHNPCKYAEPDDLTPDRFMKYGILNCPNGRGGKGASDPDAWLRAHKFVELHEPLMYDFD